MDFLRLNNRERSGLQYSSTGEDAGASGRRRILPRGSRTRAGYYDHRFHDPLSYDALFGQPDGLDSRQTFDSLVRPRISDKPSFEGLSRYRIPHSKITVTETLLGSGGSSKVVQANIDWASWFGPPEVVAKQLRYTDSSKEKVYRGFLHEIHVLAALAHPNIVELVGFVENENESAAWIVMPLHSNGNIRGFLASEACEIPERISLIQDVFKGLAYLHTFDTPICHGDLKSLNILVSSECEAIITDFGSARLMTETSDTVLGSEGSTKSDKTNANQLKADQEGGVTVEIAEASNLLSLSGPAWTLRWAAPELVMSNERPTLASDIWSAGWVCWEIMTGKVPFDDAKEQVAIVIRVIEGNLPLLREQAELGQIIALCSLVADCWKFSPEDRPNASKCLDEISWMPSYRPRAGVTPSPESKRPSSELLMSLGYVYYYQDYYEAAEVQFQQAVDAATAESDDKSIARARIALGDAHKSQGNYAEAEKEFNRALALCSAPDLRLWQATALVGLGETYVVQHRTREAEPCFELAEGIFFQLGHNQGRAGVLRGLGQVHLMQSALPRAEARCQEAAQLSAQIHDSLGQANALVLLSCVYRDQKKYAEVEKQCLKAKALFTRLGNGQGRGNACHILGDAYKGQNRFVEAEASYEEALEGYTKIGVDIDRAEAMMGLAQCYRLTSKFSEAEKTYRQALQMLPSTGTEKAQSRALQGLAAVKMNLEQHVEAQQLYMDAQDILMRNPHVGDERDRADALMKLGNSNMMQFKLAEAEAFYLEIDKIYAEADLGDEEQRVSALWMLAYTYWLQGRYSEGERMHERVHAIHESTGNAAGVASTFLGRGHIYRDQAKYAEAEKFYNDALKIYTEIGDDQGVSNTWDGLRLSREKEGRSMGE